MAKKKVIGGRKPQTINPSLTENNFPNTSNLFRVGSFDITSNQQQRSVRNFSDKLTTFSRAITLENLNLTVEDSESLSTYTGRIELNYDKENLNNYARYGSLYERLRTSIENIIQNWLGSLYVSNFYEGNFYDTIRDYSNSSVSNETSFSIPSFLIENKFDIIYTTSSKDLSSTTTSIKNFLLNYNKYEVYDLITKKSTPITGIIAPFSKNSQNLVIKTKGNIFPTASGGTTSRSFHIRPIQSEFDKFYKNLSNLERELLKNTSKPKYTFSAKLPQKDDDGNLYFQKVTYTWPTSDSYNIDIDTNSYTEYLTSILTLGRVYDEFKSDVIYRLYTPLSLKIFDKTSTNKITKYTRILGRYVDEIKIFIDGLANANSITYNKKDNLSDQFVKNFARALGWSTTDLFDEENLLNSFFSQNTEASTQDNLSASDLDIELWRRLALNSANLWKSKGTRKAIEFIFAFMGVPNCLVELNEYIYTVDGQINPDTVDLNQIFPLNQQLNKLPFDEQGYPVAPSEFSDHFFQISGNTDFGQTYLDVYRKLGFQITKVEDNKKSWIYSESVENRSFNLRDSETSYTVESSKLIINTKEVDFTIDPIKAIECDVYGYNKSNNYPVSSTGRTFPYPQTDTQKIDVSSLTFSQYVSEVYSKFINVQNRKTTTDYNGGSYPTLKKLYYDYLNRSLSEGGSQSSAITLRKIFDYSDKVQKYLDRFVQQLIPATVINSGQGVKIRNLVFTPQKFSYKHGINAGSEFQSEQPTDKIGSIIVTKIDGTVNVPYKGETRIFESNGIFNYNCDGFNSSPISTPLNSYGTTINIEPKFTSYFSVFETPSFSISGATKISSGVTPTDSIYYYDRVSTGKTISLNFSGNTDILSSETRNTKFIYDIYKYDSTISGFSSMSVYNKELDYKSFTSSTSTINEIIPRANIAIDSEYLIKGYYVLNDLNVNTGSTINTKLPLSNYELYHQNIYPIYSSQYERYFDDSLISGFTGITISLKPEYSGISLPYLLYDKDLDYYFASISDAQQPDLVFNGTFDDNITEYIVETVTVNSAKQFSITYQAAGNIEVHVNGSTLDSSEYNQAVAPTSLQGKIWNLLPSVNDDDIVTVGYIRTNRIIDFGYDNELITFIPSGNTQQLPYKILYNTGTTFHEFFLTNQVSGDTSNILLTYNGSTLQNGTDFNLSSLIKNKIILNGITPSIGDRINVYYTTASTQNSVENISNPHTFEWNVTIAPITTGGTFTLFFDDLSGNTIASANTAYIVGEQEYTNTIDFSDNNYSGLTAGSIYKYRVRNNNPFVRLNNNTIDRVSFSEYQSFKVPF